MSISSIVQCKQLTKLYNETKGIKDINLDIQQDRIVGLLGPNGSGKSTFLKLLGGYLQKTSGEVLINGEPPGPVTKKIVSYLPERNCLNNWMKVKEVIEFYADFYSDFDKEKCYQLFTELDISDDAYIKTLSKGTKEKLQLFLSISRQSKLYCFDEPIVGVDPAARENIIEVIEKHRCPGSTVLISTHLIADVEKILEDVIFIQDGVILKKVTKNELRSQKQQSVDEIFRSMYR